MQHQEDMAIEVQHFARRTLIRGVACKSGYSCVAGVKSGLRYECSAGQSANAGYVLEFQARAAVRFQEVHLPAAWPAHRGRHAAA